MLERRQFNKMLGTTLFGLTIGGMARPAFAAESPVRGGVLQVLAVVEPPVLTSIDRNGPEIIAAKIFEGLVDLDLQLNPLPALATAWDISTDALSYTFHLRPNVKWHDGEAFSSADVAYSILTLKETHPRRRATFANLLSVETPDPLTAILVFSKPAPYLFGALGVGGSMIFPRHLYEGKDLATNPAQTAPVGTGPFVFKEWSRGDYIRLDRNPDYWDTPKPYLDRVIMRFIPDISARAAALEAQELHLGTAALSEVARLVALPYLGKEVDVGRTGGGANQFFFNLDNPVLQDIRARQAIAHAIDYDAVLKNVWYGYGRLAPSVIGGNQPQFHDDAIKPYAFDRALSEKLLDEAGFPRKDDGKRFPLRLLYNAFTDTTKRVAEYLKSAFDSIGIDAQIQNYDYATYVRKVYTERAFDIDIEIYANGYDPTDGVQRGYWSKNFKPGLPWSNASHYSNPHVDEIFQTAAVEPDFEKRKALYFELQQVIYKDLPSVGLVAQDTIDIYNKNLHDHALTTSTSLKDAWLSAAAL